MKRIVECVPNFSEGRNAATVEQLVATLRAVPNVLVLDQTMDADHHRAVITYVGEPDAVVEAAVRVADVAAELIDLTHHHGGHPRIGALDVLPFVPIKGVTMDECVELARTAGERIANELQIPVYLYERAATRPSRINLADVRRGEFEGLRREIGINPDRAPDFGPAQIHPTAGATAVGARLPLIAFNVNLATMDIGIARQIARAVRGSSGGLQYVKALGVELKARGLVQVSMNLVNHESTPLFRVFDLVCREAARYGVAVVGSEIIGLVPQAALTACADYYLRIENFSPEVILEHRLQQALAARALEQHTEAVAHVPVQQKWFGNFAEAVASGTLTPAGGSVVAHTGALAAALAALVCRLNVNRNQPLGTTHAITTGTHSAPEPPDTTAEIQAIFTQLEMHYSALQTAATEDAESHERLLDAVRLDHQTEAERLARQSAIEQDAKALITLRMRVAQAAFQMLELFDELAEISNPLTFAELATGAQLTLATLRGASYQVLSNLVTANDAEFARNQRDELDDLLARAYDLADGIEARFYQTYPHQR